MSGEKARLRWLCRRGMKELDVVLSKYLQEHYDGASATQQRAFAQLLAMQDPAIYALLLGREQCDDVQISQLLDALKA